MEVRSQISFRRGRTSFYPSSNPCPYQLRGSLSCHYETLCLSSWNSFRVPHRLSTPPPSGTRRRRRRKGLPRNDRVPRRVLFSTFSFSLSLFSSSPLSFQVPLSRETRRFLSFSLEFALEISSNWTADIYARSEIFRFNIRPEEDFVSLVEPQSMKNGGCVVPPCNNEYIYTFLGKSFSQFFPYCNKRSCCCCSCYSFRGG